VARYLQSAGYRIVPVHPEGGTTLGEPVCMSIGEIPDPGSIDLVNVFRRADALPEVVEEIAPLSAPAAWFQLGVVHPAAEARALELGMDLIVNLCILVEHRRLMGGTARG
jgi:predicted CoA-binding protein